MSCQREIHCGQTHASNGTLRGNHPIELPSNDLRQQRLAYIHRNPVAAGFVDTPKDFLYSSARKYAGHPGLLEVLLID